MFRPTRIAPIALTLFAVLASTPALASPTIKPVTRIVSYADLDLASPRDQARLERRIANATRLVCITDNAIQLAQCRSKARAGAHAQMQVAAARATGTERLANAGISPVVGN